jgi:phospholipase/lecithinase/hemolysin
MLQFSDIIEDPEHFLNGTAKPNVTGSCFSCQTGECQRCTSRDSFLWFDELHPSEQASRLIAKEFKKITDGLSKHAEYWESPL